MIPAPVSAGELYARLGTASAPVLIDVHRHDTFISDDRVIIGALHRLPADVEHWRTELPTGRPVVAYCSGGGKSSQGAASALRAEGIEASYLQGGISGWKEQGFPTRKKLGARDSKWVTREHPKIDRIACPWLISRFINPLAEFIYVPANDVPAVAKEREAIPYDIKGAEFGHVGDRCSSMRSYGFTKSKTRRSTIWRRLSGCRHVAARSHAAVRRPASDLIRALSKYPDDHEMLRHGMVIYDALYTWCRLQAEKKIRLRKR
jgi:rhodanese-related sulfurtransferase